MDTLVARAQKIADELEELAVLDEPTEEQDTRMSELTDEGERVAADIAKQEKRMEALKDVRAAVESGTARIEHGDDRSGPQFMKRTETDIDVRSADRGEVRSAALKVLERDGKRLAPSQMDNVDRLVGTWNGNTDGDYIAKRLLITETDSYRSAFVKGVTSTSPIFTDDEARAVQSLRDLEQRQATLSDTAGGFGVPVLIDPSIILTSGATGAPITDAARQVTITNDEWKGVSSAGVSASYDAELAETSDDTPTLAQPTVTTYMARAWVPFSIEVGMDYPGFATEMGRLINSGLVRLRASQETSGSTPVGIFTAIDATAGSEVSVTTAGELSAVDAFLLWDALPAIYKNDRTRWIGATSTYSTFRKTAGDNAGLFSVDLTAGGIPQLFGRPVIETDYAPAFTAGTTSNQNVAIVGDMDNFLFVQRAGLTLEFVPHVFGSTNNSPTGQRGWFAWTRHGFDSINDAGFRLLKNP
jgi:HK97 family phage major capsid protein